MDIIKIGKFIAEKRKEKKLTQEQLGEKLGVTSKTISRWENGNYMPDISLLKPLSEELGVTLNDLISGEDVDKEHYQEKLEESIISTIDYTSKKVKEKSRLIAELILFFGLGITFLAFTIFPTDSSWSSIYSTIGIIISSIGFYKLNEKKSIIKRVLLSIGYFILAMLLLVVIDYSNVKINNVPPRYSYLIKSGSDMIVYKSPFCNVYRINQNTKNEYYIVDTQKSYTEDTIPITPFNRAKAGIDNIIKFKNQYIGNNSNSSHLVDNLPLSEYGYSIEINSKNLVLTINYYITDWYVNENKYLEKCLIYNSVSIFSLIDNVKYINFNFSGNSYTVSREQVEKLYPNYSSIVNNGIDKESFNKYLEEKMNDYEFVKETFNKIFLNQ